MNSRIINNHKQNLLKEIFKCGAYQEGDFTLSSGAKSNCYLDMRLLTLRSKSLYYITNIIDSTLSETTINKTADVMIYDSVGGPTIGADPIVGALLQKNVWNQNLTGFLVRSEQKEHGTKKLIEGKAYGRAMLVEDVTTTGKSLDHCITELRKINVIPQCIFTIVNRLSYDIIGYSDGSGRVLYKGIPFFYIFTLAEIQEACKRDKGV